MLRRTRTFFCALSLLLFLTLPVLWLIARKKPLGVWYKHTDPVHVPTGTIQTPHFYFLTQNANHISFGHFRDLDIEKFFETNRRHSQEQLADLQSLYQRESSRPRGNPALIQPDILQVQQVLTHLDRFFQPDGLHTGPDPLVPWLHNPLHAKTFAGITYHHDTSQTPGSIIQRWVIPLWLPLLLLLIAPLIRTISLVRTFRRGRVNQCPTCGYDLRATPAGGICPECGCTTPNPPAAVTIH